jgi:hypothetical protein
MSDDNAAKKLRKKSHNMDFVICDHAKSKECPSSIRECSHKRPHKHLGDDCSKAGCQTHQISPWKWETIAVECVACSEKPQKGST